MLKLKQAAEYARNAARGPVPAAKQIKENTLAVLNFSISDIPESGIVSKGLTAMMITDLAKVPQLKVVEREKMQALLQEVRLGQTGIVDEKSAMKTGKLLLARHVVRGSLAESQKESLRIASVVSETMTGTDLGDTRAEGGMNDLFRMEKEIVFGVLEYLGLGKKKMDKKLLRTLETHHTDSFDAFMLYARGLDALDRMQFSAARRFFEEAVGIDPGFDLAEQALLSTPKEDADGSVFLDLQVSDDSPEGTVAEDTQELLSGTLLNLETMADAAQDQTVIETEPESGIGSAHVSW